PRHALRLCASLRFMLSFLFPFTHTSPTMLYTLSLHDALPIYTPKAGFAGLDYFTYKAYDGASESNVAIVVVKVNGPPVANNDSRSEEHTSELQSLRHLVCRLLLEKKKKKKANTNKFINKSNER